MTPAELIALLGPPPDEGHAVGWLADNLIRVSDDFIKQEGDAWDRVGEMAYAMMTHADQHEI